MKTGECKFGERCRFHHPTDRLSVTTKPASQQPNVKLSLAGYPRREVSAYKVVSTLEACLYGVLCDDPKLVLKNKRNCCRVLLIALIT